MKISIKLNANIEGFTNADGEWTYGEKGGNTLEIAVLFTPDTSS